MSKEPRVTMSLSDDDINLLVAAMHVYRDDIASTGSEDPEGAEKLSNRLDRARRRVRRKEAK
jgi:hypothetical protein